MSMGSLICYFLINKNVLINKNISSGATDIFIELVDTIYLIIKMNNTQLETRYIKNQSTQRESFNLLKEGLE